MKSWLSGIGLLMLAGIFLPRAFQAEENAIREKRSIEKKLHDTALDSPKRLHAAASAAEEMGISPRALGDIPRPLSAPILRGEAEQGYRQFQIEVRHLRNQRSLLGDRHYRSILLEKTARLLRWDQMKIDAFETDVIALLEKLKEAESIHDQSITTVLARFTEGESYERIQRDLSDATEKFQAKKKQLFSSLHAHFDTTPLQTLFRSKLEVFLFDFE